MKTTHAIVMFDYEGPNPRIPNVHAFGFIQTDNIDRGLDHFGHPLKGFHVAQIAAHQHWQKHLTFRLYDNKQVIEVQHVLSYEPQHLIEHLFTWGIDMSKFDPTLPRSA